MSRGHIRGAAAWSFLLISPMLVPHIVLAVAMYSVFSSLGLAGSKIGLALAHGVLGLPFVILNVAASLRDLPKDTENAAMSLGARPVAVLLEITVPLIWRGILAGAIFAFVVSFDEVVISMFLSSSSSPTLPKRMLDGIFFDLSPILAAVSASLVVFNVALASMAVLLTRASAVATR
jgi:ABC-type spermidine/putrescine transport system permease subunit II